jgi:hypothetical protein
MLMSDRRDRGDRLVSGLLWRASLGYRTFRCEWPARPRPAVDIENAKFGLVTDFGLSS